MDHLSRVTREDKTTEDTRTWTGDWQILQRRRRALIAAKAKGQIERDDLAVTIGAKALKKVNLASAQSVHDDSP